MNVKKLFGVFIAMLCATAFLQAQEKTVTGNVVDQTGVPLPGVNIIVEGTTNGTQTDFDGNYAINVAEGQAIVFTYLGQKTERVVVGTSNTIDVVMQEDAQTLEEVVLIGYGSTSKKLSTNNSVKIASQDTKDIPTPSFQNVLSGRAAGVQVIQNNGKVDAGIDIRIRGVSSISAGDQPLFVVDGVPIFNADQASTGGSLNPLLTIPTSDIESIDILKDASAVAIYGSRGNNGVVLITTKKGKFGAPQITVNTAYGISKETNRREFLNSDQYIELFTEAAVNSTDLLAGFGITDPVGFVQGRFNRYSNGTWENARVNTDWQDEVFRTGYNLDANASISGATEKVNYLFNFGYTETEGILRGNDLQRFTTRLKLDFNVTEKLRLGANISYTRALINRLADDNSFLVPLQAVAQTPISPLQDTDGNLARQFNTGPNGEGFLLYANFLRALALNSRENTQNRILGNLFGEYQIFDGLKYRSEFGYDWINQAEYTFFGPGSPFDSTDGTGTSTNFNNVNFNLANYLTFNKDFGEHNLNFTGGIEYQQGDSDGNSVTGIRFPLGLTTIRSAGEITGGDSFESKYTLLSYFARLGYSFNEKYLVNASFRRDGSSRFGINEQWGNFSSISGAWIVTEEGFLQDNEVLTFLKLRAGWGQAGNFEIGNFAARSRFTARTFNQNPGITFAQTVNPNLTWETSDGFDVGFDFGLWGNALSGEINYYSKDIEDLLFNENIPGSSGNNQVLRNIGNMRNSGIEITLRSTIVDNGDFTLSLNTNLTTLNNEITSLPNGNDIITGVNILREGETINSFFIREFAGANPDNGDALYFLNGATTSTTPTPNQPAGTTNSFNEANRIIAGSPIPDLIAGFGGSATYKNFDFSFTFQGEFGASIFNGGGRFMSASADFFDNQTSDQLRRWQQPGDITDVPQARLFAGNGTGDSTRYLDENDFVRLRNITLGYSFPTSITERMGMDNLRIYLTGFNILTFTDYEGWDPEARRDDFARPANITVGGAGAGTILTGQEFYSAPPPKTITLGLNVNF
ncbi:MAG: TonB-dependent receptor [Bacteroidota bacterium]